MRAAHNWQRASIGQTKAITFGPVTIDGVRQDLTDATITLVMLRAGYALGRDYWPYWGAETQDDPELEGEACTPLTQTGSDKGKFTWTPGASDLDTAGEWIVQFKITESGGAIYYWPEDIGDSRLLVGPVLS